ncbi:low molecular weight phosphotyrosine protein phosphatase [Gilvimarinus agarilyticus]|uniref:low molecular weight protein-tyrosine-phosphatase n=1 Tax=unclassified Gilvimarinus TaxID=2642066 RepID=UPI001C0A62A1|nr:MULTISPECIES: low molecular weight protein-tyrosine-phosphatase [unclassified Gilvimarinus]MBU2887422.1 low molecular weight phosphotyrosine protein phosphatase [Gilvimarinus agarilyticus]MDO6572081.1 low molecular weight protein-tyrosine-phosphatase [Gilvimarinus sp. 2_MG-2023]MDO6746142.1 low molecular weight protein-tyrosine-phosphatase [Gilvimarinus sp. 1_MG-2023]
MSVSVLFVCLGNICRSPTAEGLFKAQLEKVGLEDVVATDSAGTGGWHTGNPPDKRAISAAAERGIDISVLRARQVQAVDFDRFDYVLAMDSANLSDLQALRPEGFTGQLSLFLDYAQDTAQTQVPDPYYGGDEGFEHVLDLIEQAAEGLLADIRQRHLT